MVRVKMSNSFSNGELDELLMAQIQGRWLKVARVMATIILDHDMQDEDRILSRIKALAKAKKIESAGDLNKPRYSEVRLPVSSKDGSE